MVKGLLAMGRDGLTVQKSKNLLTFHPVMHQEGPNDNPSNIAYIRLKLFKPTHFRILLLISLLFVVVINPYSFILI